MHYPVSTFGQKFTVIFKTSMGDQSCLIGRWEQALIEKGIHLNFWIAAATSTFLISLK